MTKPTNLYIVVPCYNEEAVISETASRLLELFDKMKRDFLIDSLSRIVFVDDGSKDATWDIITSLASEYDEIYGIKLAKNAGHQNALFAGLMTVKDSCECAISIDADLQDDVSAIYEMVQKFSEGTEIVYGVRSNRDSDTLFKRKTAQSFYRLMKLLGVNMVFNHADYRLMSAKALNALAGFNEVNLFLRGIVPLLGFKTDTVYYTRGERFAGTSKYPLKKMISFALEAITSFSVTPIRIISTIGVIACLIAVAVAIYTLVQKFTGHTDAGWASIMISIWFIGGVQLVSLGIIGEYIGKMYKEVKHRPRYIIEEVRF
ncbi:MAG: glycosyltransferase family 2 protein [Clostridia bacterium]|nr:glycosyltransferase family 2 protein [Clostridia bacterium]